MEQQKHSAIELIKQAWDEHLFRRHSANFLDWYHDGVKELEQQKIVDNQELQNGS